MPPTRKYKCSHCGKLLGIRTCKDHLTRYGPPRTHRSNASPTSSPPSRRKSAHRISKKGQTRNPSSPLPQSSPAHSPIQLHEPTPEPLLRGPIRLNRVLVPDADEDDEMDLVDDDSDEDDESEVDPETGEEFLFMDPNDPDGSIWQRDREERWNQQVFDAVATEGLSERDLAMLRQFQLLHQHRMSRECWNAHDFVFPDAEVFTIPELRSRVQNLSGFKPEVYDCCRLSCVLYVGPWADCETCPNPKCGLDRRRPNGTPYKTFSYLPLIPQLSALFSSPEIVELLQYRAQYTNAHPRNNDSGDDDNDDGGDGASRTSSPEPAEAKPEGFFSAEKGKVKDTFDGTYYRELCRSTIEIDGKCTGRRFFEDDRDLALGLSTDGFAPFKRRKHSAWPLIIFIYNLPPSLRFLLQHIICIGVIPGPKAPWDLDSYVIPLINELERLASDGASVYDSLAREMFQLRAHLIKLFGDMPAVAKAMRMKGAVAIKACRTCDIVGLRIPSSSATTHYAPLDRSRHPNRGEVAVYDANHLPLRQHADFVAQAQEIELASTRAEQERLRTSYGITGISSFLRLPSITFPTCMPLDFMHLIWENLAKNLVMGLWSGDWKGVDHSDYSLSSATWHKISKAVVESGSTIPASLGARVPDFITRPSEMTAETWSFLILYLLPIALRNQFRSRVYYAHFLELVDLLKSCIALSMTDEEVNRVEAGFVKWVRDYERLYYRRDPRRASVCPITVHALLHIARDIRQHGPVWTHWAYPMERFCGVVQRAVHSRRYPWAEIDNFVKHRAQLRMVSLKYQLGSYLDFARQHRQKAAATRYRHPKYEGFGFAAPTLAAGELASDERKKIAAHFATRFSRSAVRASRGQPAKPAFKVTATQVLKALPRTATRWGKFAIDGGNLMHAANMQSVRDPSDETPHRDPTYVRYQLLVDRQAHRVNAPSVFEPRVFYGRLLDIYQIHFPATPELQHLHSETFILARIQPCPDQSGANDYAPWYTQSEYDSATPEVIDISCISSVVGRFYWDQRWHIIDLTNGTLDSVIPEDVIHPE